MRPQLHCNGKCYLMKKLKQADESEKKQAEKNQLKNSQVYLLQQIPHLSFAPPSMDAESSKPPILYSFRYVSPHIDGVFRPPRISGSNYQIQRIS